MGWFFFKPVFLPTLLRGLLSLKLTNGEHATNLDWHEVLELGGRVGKHLDVKGSTLVPKSNLCCQIMIIIIVNIDK